MIPESIDSAKSLYVLGSIILVIGLIAGVAGTLIKRRLEEDHRDERYVRERRGEEVAESETPRIANLLRYAGVTIVGIGILVLVAGWTVAPGQT
jgi:Ca2+/Na+ antiporter